MFDIFNHFKDFKSFEVAFHDKNKGLQKIFCNVKAIENNMLIVNANNKLNNGTFAEVGNELQLHIYTDNGIYSATSKVIVVTKGILNTEYIISYPSHSKHSQRREYFRADIAVKFDMKVFEDDSYKTFSTFEGVTKNICGKGMSYIADKPFSEYYDIKLEMFFEDRKIETSAQLVYTKQIIVNEKTKFINAFTFTTITSRDIEFLIKKCFLHQLDLRKKSIWD